MGLSLLQTLRTLFGTDSGTQQKRQRAFITAYEFPSGLVAKFAAAQPALSTRERDEVFEALRDYFLLCHEASGKMVAMPSRIVDAAWHEFILFTREYNEFCSTAFGRFLHHTPSEAMRPDESASIGLELAWELACAQEGIDPTQPHQLPRLFALDEMLNVPNGSRYDAAGMAQRHTKYHAAVTAGRYAAANQRRGRRTRGNAYSAGGAESGIGGDGGSYTYSGSSSRHGSNCDDGASSDGCSGGGGADGGSSCGGSSCGGSSCGGGGCGGS